MRNEFYNRNRPTAAQSIGLGMETPGRAFDFVSNLLFGNDSAEQAADASADSLESATDLNNYYYNLRAPYLNSVYQLLGSYLSGTPTAVTASDGTSSSSDSDSSNWWSKLFGNDNDSDTTNTSTVDMAVPDWMTTNYYDSLLGRNLMDTQEEKKTALDTETAQRGLLGGSSWGDTENADLKNWYLTKTAENKQSARDAEASEWWNIISFLAGDQSDSSASTASNIASSYSNLANSLSNSSNSETNSLAQLIAAYASLAGG